jgi:hypothetical protein
MKKFINITEDATIYQSYPTINTGLDEVLEVGKTVKWLEGSDRYTSASVRFLINFNLSDLAQYPSASYKLSLKLANAKEVDRYQKINAYLLTSPWVEGSGYFYQDVQNVQDGVSWEMADKNTNWSVSGSDFTSVVSASVSLSEYPLSDVTMDITELMSGPLFSAVPWYGLVIKFDSASEADAGNVGNIKFFSSNTHTIFSPKIEINQVDVQFVTGTLKPIPNSSVAISPRNLKQAYTVGEVDKIYLSVRDKYPDKKFDATQRYKSIYYLPSESYFRIKDDSAGVTLYDFNAFSTINCDVSGSYILLDTSGFEVNRYYTIDLKIKKDNLVFFPEFNYTFTVDRNG